MANRKRTNTRESFAARGWSNVDIRLKMPIPNEMTLAELFDLLKPTQKRSILSTLRRMAQTNLEESAHVASRTEDQSKGKDRTSMSQVEAPKAARPETWFVDGRVRKPEGHISIDAVSAAPGETVTCKACGEGFFERDFEEHWNTKHPSASKKSRKDKRMLKPLQGGLCTSK